MQVFHGGPGGLAATPTTTLTSAGWRDKFGSWVASAGDTNGDGFGDLIVGVIGALVGGFLFGLFGLSADGRLGSLVTATVGAIALIALLRVINRPRL